MVYSEIAPKQKPVIEIYQDGRHEKEEEEYPALEPDVDIYEETDECDLEKSAETVWLVKLPQFIQECWDGIPSDSEAEIELGTILINKNDPTMVKLILSNDKNINEGLPREYDLKNSSKPEISNTFIFTEKDDKKRKLRSSDDDFPEIPRRLLWKGDNEKAKKRFKRSEGTPEEEKKEVFIKIPYHQTAVVGTVIADLQMKPVPNAEYREFERKQQVAAKRGRSVKLLDNITKDNILNPGTIGAVKSRSFLKIAQPSEKARTKTLDKAFRISKEEVQTKLFALFEKYEYYKMKDLVEKLHQPQAYLQEVLEDIGKYNTYGSFSGKWCLRNEYKQAMGDNEAYKSMDKR